MAKVKAIPEGLHTVTPALTIDGCAEAIELYKKAFGAEERSRAPDPSGKKVWHAEIQIVDSRIFLSDEFPEMGSGKASPARFWIYGEDVDGRYQRALKSGMKSKSEPMDMFWGDRTCTVADRWGNEWTLVQRIKDMTQDEMMKAGQEFAKKMSQSK